MAAQDSKQLLELSALLDVRFNAASDNLLARIMHETNAHTQMFGLGWTATQDAIITRLCAALAIILSDPDGKNVSVYAEAVHALNSLLTSIQREPVSDGAVREMAKKLAPRTEEQNKA